MTTTRTADLTRMALAAAFGIAVSGALAAPALAAGTQIGSTTLPSQATMPPSSCSTGQTTEVVPYATSGSPSYAVPSGGGSLTSWSFNTTGATPGTPYTLLVLQPSGSSYQIVATDPETVPSGGAKVATFKLSRPITVAGGDLIGSVVSAKSRVGCLFKGGSIPSNDVIGFTLGPDTTGTSFTLQKTIANELVNVSATVVQSNDLSITDAAEPASVALGDDVTFALNVSSAGPSSTAETVTDTLPAGLAFVSASAGTGTCQSSGRTVTCQVPGAPASLSIVARPTRAGTFTNSAAVTGPLLDPNKANNTAKAAVKVTK